MAKSRICSIPDCGKPVRGRGWCTMHYCRYRRYGDPLAGRTAEGAPRRFVTEIALAHDNNECLMWPYGRTSQGYGIIMIDGRSVTANRYICSQVNGPPPTHSLEAAHSCGNQGCVNPRHLRWATPKENSADKLVHGTTAWGERSAHAKLTEAEVLQIRNSTETGVALAARYGVSKSHISGIRSGKFWARLRP